MKEFSSMYPEIKEDLYALLHAQLKALIEGEREVIPNLANTSALLVQALQDINWVGFYLMKNDELLLGPFQGKPACIHIPMGKGVCGTAALENRTQLVSDVHAFPGHIACDSASRSEIVIPICVKGSVVGVLDIDSPVIGRFDEVDRAGLEGLVRTLEAGCLWKEA